MNFMKNMDMKNKEEKMIDIAKVKEEFEKYVADFDITDDKILLKKEHIERVATLSKMIATNVGLNKEEILLAEVIGYFHDIGRFEQVRKYNTFNDRASVNHAEYSNKVLFEDRLIEKFNIDKKYWSIIEKAVLNHNKDKIEKNLTDEEKLFAKIIRDADKLDIFYVICNYKLETVFWFDRFDIEKIDAAVFNEYKEKHRVNYKNIHNNADQICAFYAFVFDLNFDISRKYLKEKDYLNYFAKRLEMAFDSSKVKEQLKEIVTISNNYLEKI